MNNRLFLIYLCSELTRTREGRATLRGANALAEAMMHTIRTIRNCMVDRNVANLVPEAEISDKKRKITCNNQQREDRKNRKDA